MYFYVDSLPFILQKFFFYLHSRKLLQKKKEVQKGTDKNSVSECDLYRHISFRYEDDKAFFVLFKSAKIQNKFLK